MPLLCEKEIMNELKKIKKVIDLWYKERYDTDWDFLQASLMEIKEILDKD